MIDEERGEISTHERYIFCLKRAAQYFEAIDCPGLAQWFRELLEMAER